jgi:hypothetical protein
LRAPCLASTTGASEFSLAMPDEGFIVEVDKEGGEPIGVGLQNEDGAALREDHILVAYVEQTSLLSGKVEKGDEIMSVNNKSFSTAKECSEAIKAVDGKLTLRVRAHRAPAAHVALIDGCVRAAADFADSAAAADDRHRGLREKEVS